MMVDILLSTYQSEAFLEALLESLYLQSYSDWRLIVRDDGSTDKTRAILNQHKEKHPNKIQLIEADFVNLGPKRSFEKLLVKSTAEYIMFCDHDDYWLVHKIEDSLTKIQSLESKNTGKAALVFSDLIITDDKLKPIHDSFWNYAKINPQNIHSVYKLVINNPVVGCTVIMNKFAKDLVLPISEQAIMHDWWAALKVAENGVIDYIEKPTLLYRQHPKNEIGVDQAGLAYFLSRFFNFSKTLKQNKEAYQMLKALDKKYTLVKFMGCKISVLFSKAR